MIAIPRPSLEIAERAWPAQEQWPHCPRNRWTVSVHEAAHLVAILVADLYPDAPLMARVFPDGVSGEVRVRADPDPVEHSMQLLPEAAAHPGYRVPALAWAAMYAAGDAAEIVLHGLQDWIRGWPEPLAATPDFRAVAFFLSFGWPNQKGGAAWVAWRHALHIVTKNWSWILRVATEIDACGKCSAARARELEQP